MRFNLSRGHINDAKKVLEACALENKKPMPLGRLLAPPKVFIQLCHNGYAHNSVCCHKVTACCRVDTHCVCASQFYPLCLLLVILGGQHNVPRSLDLVACLWEAPSFNYIYPQLCSTDYGGGVPANTVYIYANRPTAICGSSLICI